MTIIAAPVTICSVPPSADAMPAIGPWSSSESTIGGRHDQAETGEGAEEQHHQDREVVDAGGRHREQDERQNARRRTRRSTITRGRPKRAPSRAANCEEPMKPIALTEKARLYCVGVSPKCSM